MGEHLVVASWLLALLGAAECFQNPSRKTWWAKRVVSDDYFTAGRLSLRQVKYAGESGFKSIVSLFTNDQSVGEDTDGAGTYLPTSAEARKVSELFNGITYRTVHAAGKEADWKTLAGIRQAGEVLRAVPKPVLFHCGAVYAASFTLLAHLANLTSLGLLGPSETVVKTNDVFLIGAIMGFNFSDDETLVELITQITHENVTAATKSSVTVPEWYLAYWLAKPVYGHWFITGQFQEDQIDALGELGFKSIINSRRSNTVPPGGGGIKSQEEVTLLNIRDRTGTYASEGRQSTDRLLDTRLDSLKPKQYIHASSVKNFEDSNRLEFGDNIGYNEQLEKRSIASKLPNVHYANLPLGGEYGYSTAMWKAYRPQLEAADSRGPVLLQCRTGFRSSILSILSVAYINKFDSAWALQRAREIGYDYSTKAPEVADLYRSVLDGRKDEASTGACAVYCFSHVFLSLLIYISMA